MARYFEMWNGAETAIAGEILMPDWLDHAHPEAPGPDAVAEAVVRIRAARPDFAVSVRLMLESGDLVAAFGSATATSPASAGETTDPGEIVWLIRFDGERMAEMWTYRRQSG